MPSIELKGSILKKEIPPAELPKRKTALGLIFLLLFSTINPVWKNDAYAMNDAEGAAIWVTGGLSLLGAALDRKSETSSMTTVNSTFRPTTHPIEHFEESEKYSVLRWSSKTETICIDSNVPATVYVNKKKVGNTPFCGEIENGLTTEVVLATEKYKPKKVPLEKRIHHDILSSLSYWTDFKYSSRPTTFNRTTANVGQSSSPASNDMTMTSQGRWIEYSKNSYFVEFPDPRSETTESLRKRTDAFEWQVREFALKYFI